MAKRITSLLVAVMLVAGTQGAFAAGTAVRETEKPREAETDAIKKMGPMGQGRVNKAQREALKRGGVATKIENAGAKELTYNRMGKLQESNRLKSLEAGIKAVTRQDQAAAVAEELLGKPSEKGFDVEVGKGISNSQKDVEASRDLELRIVRQFKDAQLAEGLSKNKAEAELILTLAEKIQSEVTLADRDGSILLVTELARAVIADRRNNAISADGIIESIKSLESEGLLMSNLVNIIRGARERLETQNLAMGPGKVGALDLKGAFELSAEKFYLENNLGKSPLDPTKTKKDAKEFAKRLWVDCVEAA